MRYSRAELERYAGAGVDDLIGPDPRLIFVGINPGLWTAATNTHFCHPSNRFYKALHLAGLADVDFDVAVGMSDEDREGFTRSGIGITNLVNRATARASELSVEELRIGARVVERKVEEWQPGVVAVAGVSAYRIAFERPRAGLGRQPERLGTAELWVVPNPSGLNAHETLESLARWYRLAGEAAGL